jgi:hypothetical protein
MPFPVKYSFPEIVEGDLFLGEKFQLSDGADEPIDLTGCEAKMQIRRTPGNKVMLEFSGTDIELSGNEIYLKEKAIDIPYFNYQYDLQVKYPDGGNLTLLTGLFIVKPQITI